MSKQNSERLALHVREIREKMDMATKQIQETARSMHELAVHARPTHLIQEEP